MTHNDRGGASSVVDVDDDDEELAAEALAADPDPPLAHDAVALADPRAAYGVLLPGWYMPPPASTMPPRTRWRTAVVVLLIASLLLINALGFCITYGNLTLA